MMTTTTKNRQMLPVRSSQRARLRRPLRFTPHAWAKLLFLRDAGSTEVGGFGVSAADDLLLVEDVCLVEQETTLANVAFDDASVADYFDRQVDQGRMPDRFARIWIHTHPGNCPRPSAVDEETFVRCFGAADWALMFILAAGGQTYARLSLRAGPGATRQLPVAIDFGQRFPGSDPAAWQEEYIRNVFRQPEWSALLTSRGLPAAGPCGDRPVSAPNTHSILVDPWEILDGRF